MSAPVPPPPPGWNKTLADLFAEAKRGERKSIGNQEAAWARAYERSLLPAQTRFPKKGDLYEALEDLTVNYLTAWQAPFTGGAECLMLKGDRVLVDDEPGQAEPITVYARAVDYERLERRIVPESDRTHPKYGGFYVALNTADLNTKFRLVSETL
ncbi:MAG: hypothetical protein HS116_24100 [Planctomycetes bacterium]|nr:hypothetical protein [Planctomycetota bacterium]